MQKRQLIIQTIRIICSLTVLALLFYRIDWRHLVLAFRAAAPSVLGVVFLLLVPSLAVRSYRWLMLFNGTDVSISFRDSTKLLMAGMCLNLVLPASLGDIAKSYFGYRWSGIKERMLAVSVLDKLIALASVCLLGMPFAIYRRQYVFALAAVMVIAVTILLSLLPYAVVQGRPLHSALGALTARGGGGRVDLLAVIDQTRTTGAKLTFAVLLSIVGWVLTYLQLYLIVRALQLDISLLYVLAAAPFLTLVRLFPFALQGLGTDELAICFVFKHAGIGYEQGMAAALLYRFFLLILPGLAGLAILVKQKHVITVGRKQPWDCFIP